MAEDCNIELPKSGLVTSTSILNEIKKPQEDLMENIKEIVFKGHKIALITEQGAESFSEYHINSIYRILDFYWDIDPEIVKGYVQFISTDKEGVTDYGDIPLNGENGPIIGGEKHTNGAIRFTKRGMKIDIAHRVSSTDKAGSDGFVDNFTGTVAHEIAHGYSVERPGIEGIFYRKPELQKQFSDKWWEMSGWSFHYDKQLKQIIFTPKFPEKCIGGKDGYAAKRPEEDFCDSMAAYILNPNILFPEKRELLNMQINAYKASVNN